LNVGKDSYSYQTSVDGVLLLCTGSIIVIAIMWKTPTLVQQVIVNGIMGKTILYKHLYLEEAFIGLDR